MTDITPSTSHTSKTVTPPPSDELKQESRIDRFLRKKDLEELFGVTISTIYRWIQSEGFPYPVRLAAKTVAWPESEVKKWVNNRQRTNNEAFSTLNNQKVRG